MGLPMGTQRALCSSEREVNIVGRLAFIWLLVNVAICPSQARIYNSASPTVDVFAENVVRLTVERNNGTNDVGFGLLAFAKQNRLFVVTADHVLRGNAHSLTPTKIIVNFHERLNRSPMEVTSISRIFDANLDIAAFEIWNPGDALQFSMNAKDWNASLPLARGSQYYFVGRNQTWYVSTRPATFNSVSPLGGYVFDQVDAQPGSSGAPMYSEEDGLVAGLIREK